MDLIHTADVAKAKAKAKAKQAKPAPAPKALYLITEPDEMLDGTRLRPGMFENPDPKEIRAYEPDDIAYYVLSTNNSRYLEVDRLWPVRTNPSSKLERDDMWGGWKFKLVELGAPMMLDAAATWQALLDAGVRLKPKKTTHPSILNWPAIKGHVEALRVLVEAGGQAGADDVVMGAAAFGKRETTRLLVEKGFDGTQAVITMKRYKNQVALDILRELGFE